MAQLSDKKYRHAFTLVEITVVVIIMGIAGAVVVPMISNTRAMQLRANAVQIVNELQKAQTTSIASRKSDVIVFDSGNNRYQVVQDGGTTVTYPLNSDVAIQSVNFNNDNNVWFNSIGGPLTNTTASPDGTPMLNGSVVLTSGDEQITITVEPVTGRVTIQG